MSKPSSSLTGVSPMLRRVNANLDSLHRLQTPTRSPMICEVEARLSRSHAGKMKAHVRKTESSFRGVSNTVNKAAGSRFAELFYESNMSERERKFWWRMVPVVALFGLSLCIGVEWYGSHIEAEIAAYSIEDTPTASSDSKQSLLFLSKKGREKK